MQGTRVEGRTGVRPLQAEQAHNAPPRQLHEARRRDGCHRHTLTARGRHAAHAQHMQVRSKDQGQGEFIKWWWQWQWQW